MRVLVDTSVWIDYFKTGDNSENLDYLIDNNLVYTNDLIITELIPSLRLKNQGSIIKAIHQVAKFPLLIGWQDIQDYQFNCLKAGINGVGIPDLIILQNAIQNDCQIYTLDKHFRLIQEVLDITLYE
jgi:predicted nucleic acid-binding protein